MIQYENISDNGKKAIEQFRMWVMKTPYKQSMHDLYISLQCSLTLNNEYDAIMRARIIELAESKNYWLTDTKKEENK